jgi:uncharacterized protein YydD (DUF2326 family)
MSHRIFSSLSSFKELEFKPGLNVLIAQQESVASAKQTRNRAGKTSLIEIIHFLTGSDAGKAADLRAQLTVAEARLNDLKAQVSSFRVLPQYEDLEAEATKITQRLKDISNSNFIDTAAIRDLESAMQGEAPPAVPARACAQELDHRSPPIARNASLDR